MLHQGISRYHKMENQLTCPICLGEYDTSDALPVVGTCGHSICQACWNRLSDKKCPTCKKSNAFDVKVVNYALRDQLENACRARIVDEETSREETDDTEEINVVVLSETGVGKSTWINAIANYITYETVEEALSKPHINLIPTKFTISVKNGAVMKKTSVSVGNDCANEVHEAAAPSTQHPRAYVFAHNKKMYRMIDTPGIGDTRGLKQDQENIRNIINFIAKYNKIHAICILMMPNQAKLTERFEFCFNELIMQFHRSAVQNIIFGFTNTSGCGFCVGETHEPLEELINDINRKQNIQIILDGTTMYPFDNMAYRYLCVKSMGTSVEFSPDLESIYKNSFVNSRNETLRLFEYIETLPPHNTELSVTLKYVRDVIEKLTGPLAEINAKVNETLGNISDKENDIHINKNRQKDLKKTLMRKLKITHYELQNISVYFCKMCSELRVLRGADRQEYIDCDPSLASSNPLEMWTVKKYLDSEEPCPKCGDRKNVKSGDKKFTRVTEEKEEEDPNQRERLTDMESLRKEAERQLSAMMTIHKEISAEQEEILNASASFACFMKRNCITTYNDVAEKYISQLIEVAKRKNQKEKEEGLKEQLMKYREQKRIYEESMRNAEERNEPSIGPKDVMRIANRLQKLKFYGRDVALALNSAHDRTNDVRFEELYYSAQTGLVNISSVPRRVVKYMRNAGAQLRRIVRY